MWWLVTEEGGTTDFERRKRHTERNRRGGGQLSIQVAAFFARDLRRKLCQCGTVSLLSVPPQGLKQRAYLRPLDGQLLPLLSPFVESKADAPRLVDLFRMILVDNFGRKVQAWVSLAMSPLQDDEFCLGWLLEVSNCWICEHAAKEVNELPPPVRSKLVLVNQNDGDDDHGGHRVNTFTLRRGSLKLKAVLHSFLKMWWRFPTTAFDALKAKIEAYYKRPERALSVTTSCPVVQDFLESSVIGALFLPIHQGKPDILPNKMGLDLLFSRWFFSG